jgi:hypothetical protein
LIDPVLVAELATAGADDPVAALIMLKGELRRALAAEGRPSAPLVAASELAAARRGTAPAPGWTVELYPELGALYVRAPAAVLVRLLADSGVASATLPDEGP